MSSMPTAAEQFGGNKANFSGGKALLPAVALATMLAGSSAYAAKLNVPVNQALDGLTFGLNIPADAATRGMWAPLKNWPLMTIHMALLPNGKVASYGSPIGQPVQEGRTYDVWNPTVGYQTGSHFTRASPDSVNSFCSTSTFLLDGQLLMSGGIFANNTDKNSALLSPTGEGVSLFPYSYAADRYYATMLTLPDGRPLIMGGSYPYLGGFADPEGSIRNGWMTGMTPEVYETGRGWRSLFGAKSRDAFGPDNSRFWYPRAWVSPRGDVFGISSEVMWALNPAGDGSVQVKGWFKTPQNRSAATAFDAPNVGPNSTAVMYDVGKILQVGGNAYTNGDGFLSSSRATIVDINGANPVVSETAAMNFGRGWANATLLPTGDVLVNGGSKYNDAGGDNVVLPTETWSPKTGRWTLGASASVYRGYHSASILLQNGAVLTGGGGAPGPVNNLNAEVYYPPYLFSAANGQTTWANRPLIQSVSTRSLGYGVPLQIELNDGATAAQVTFVPLGQTTHSFNTTQRFYSAAATQNGAIVAATTPNSSNIAPPGYYLVSVVDPKGVPSPSVIVAIGGAAPPPGDALAPAQSLPLPTAETAPKGVPLVASHSNMCLEAGAVGAAVTQRACNAADNQKWQAFETNSGKLIRNVGTKNCLEVAGSSANPGAMVSTRACESQTNQIWGVSGLNAGYRYMALNSNLCLGVRGANQAAGAELAVDACTNDQSQSFTATGATVGSTATNWVKCADEGGKCTFGGSVDVRYGAGATFTAARSFTGGTACTNEVFGDPIPGTIKRCEYNAAQVATVWTKCADEGGQCSFAGSTDVRYGAGTTFTAARSFTGGTACTNNIFGDPLPGTVKRCEVKTAQTPVVQPWTTCAKEGGRCDFTTPMEIRFGEANTFTTPRQFARGTACTNEVFGDPLYGTVKRCEARAVTN